MMPEPKFLYGSHYSSPGFVLFYLVRVGMYIFGKVFSLRLELNFSYFFFLRRVNKYNWVSQQKMILIFYLNLI